MVGKQFGLVAIAAALLLGIPAVGYVSAFAITKNIDSKVAEAFKNNNVTLPDDFTVGQICSREDILSDLPKFRPLCSELSGFVLLEDWSLYTGVFGIFYLFIVILAGRLASRNRVFLIALFKPLLLLTQLSIAYFVVAHGAILIAAIYFTETYWLGRVHAALLLFAGIAVAGAGLRILASVFTRIKKAEATVLGRSLKRTEAPTLWNLVDEIAALAKAKSPDNVIVGMSPTFFVTEAPVTNLDGKSRGRTLYLSLPFCRLLSVQELKAIIAHEFGHFVGHDTRFSQHFYPIYRGAAESLQVLHQSTEGEGGLHTLALLPSTFIMSFFFNSFSSAENRISRDRELEADALSGRIVGRADAATALVKVHAFSRVWPYTESKMLDALSERKQLINAATFFEAVATNLPADFVSKGLEETHTEHPTDSHPTLKVRLEGLGISLTPELITKALTKVDSPASSRVDRVEDLEKLLTDFEHEKLGRQVKPDHQVGTVQDMSFRLVFLRCLILMMLVDESVKDEEIAALKSIIKKVTDEDVSDAELKLETSKAGSWAEDLFAYLAKTEPLLKKPAKVLLIKGMFLMAVSDGMFHDSEKDLLTKSAMVLQISPEEIGAILAEMNAPAA